MIWEGVRAFVKKYALVTVAVGFLVGHSGSQFLESIIEGLIMPLFNPFLDGHNWHDHVVNLGPFNFHWGPIVSTGFHFTAVIIVVVVVIKIFDYEEEREDAKTE